MMIKIFKNPAELSFEFCNELMKKSSQKGKCFIALCGGSTPKIIFQTLSEHFKDRIQWNKIHLFWSDERCVSPDDSESNYGMAKQYLLDFISIPEENIHRIKGENEPGLEAVRYSEEINNVVNSINGLPSFDLVVLGIGEDGHTASIFPDQMHLLNSQNICEVAIHPSNGQKRITLTGSTINNSDTVIFIVTGNSKAGILYKIIEEKKKIYPAEFIKPVSGNLKYFIDEEASQLLEKKPDLTH
jgi:6-phosphogluconolactonase